MHGPVHGSLRQAGRVVERHAVQVADAHDDLERVAKGVPREDAEDDRPAQGTPDELITKKTVRIYGYVPEQQDTTRYDTYDGDGLDAEHEGVRREVSGVGQSVLLPCLAEDRLEAG